MSKLTPFAKAIIPALVTLLATLGYSLASGRFDQTSILIAGVGLVGAVITFFVPNVAPEVQAVEAVLAGTPETAVTPDPPVAVPAPAPAAPAPPAPPAA